MDTKLMDSKLMDTKLMDSKLNSQTDPNLDFSTIQEYWMSSCEAPQIFRQRCKFWIILWIMNIIIPFKFSRHDDIFISKWNKTLNNVSL